MNNIKIKDLKLRINKFVDKQTCDNFIKLYENNSTLSEKESSYKYISKKREEDNFKCISLSKMCNKSKELNDAFLLAADIIGEVVRQYELYIQKNVLSTYEARSICYTENIRILKYSKGQCIKDHTDVGGTYRGSCTINLNENYEGGEFRFFNGQIKETLKTGDCLFFPAEPIWIHGTEPITKGTRYSINCFLGEKNV